MLPPFPSVLSGIFIHKNRNVLNVLFYKQPFCHLLPHPRAARCSRVHYNNFMHTAYISSLFIFSFMHKIISRFIVYMVLIILQICDFVKLFYESGYTSGGKPLIYRTFFHSKKYSLLFLKKYAILFLFFCMIFVFLFLSFSYVYLFINSCPIHNLYRGYSRSSSVRTME